MSRSIRRNALLAFACAGALSFANPAFAIFQNGGFELNDYSSWLLGGGSNPGLTGAPPFTGANIQVTAGAPGPATLVNAVTDVRAPLLVLPRVGATTSKLNDEAGGRLVTTLRQIDTVTAADIDPSDGLPHIRFSFAPVLEDPSHSAEDQPYFYVSLRRVSDNSLLFEQFAYSGQAGVNFLNGQAPWKYLQFQDVDIVLPANAIGEQVELTVLAADCSLGAHGGYVYIDGFGSAVLPPPGGSNAGIVQEVPATSLWALLLMGLGMVWVARRNQQG
ncbi:MAG: hypothetical protein IPK97_12025 [Ahniella sp.]|nr:hypothetical protein [Ahniella sp.]